MKKIQVSFVVIIMTIVLIGAGTHDSRTEASKKPYTAVLPTTNEGMSPPALVNPAALPAAWSAPENASNTPNFSQTPVATLDGKGNVYICWDEWFGQLGDRRDIMFNTNKSGAWNAQRTNTLQYPFMDEVGFPEVAATQSGTDAVYVWFDRDVARARMVVDADERTGGTWTGLQWISSQVGDSSRRVTIAASTVDDTLGFVWEQDVPSGVNLIYQYRDGTTGRMSAPALISGGQAGSQYLPNMCIDAGGKAHVVYYSGAADTVVWYTENANPKNLGGWTTPIALSGVTGVARVFPKVAAAADGDAYVVWTEYHGGGNEEVFLRYQVNGVWQTAAAISQTPTFSEFPSVAVHPLTKDVFLSWSESADGITANIMVKTFETDKTTGTRAWSANYQVDAANASELSCIRVSAQGDVHLVYAEGGEIWHVQRIAPRLAAVAAPAVTSQLDRIVFAARKFNTIAFAKNPANDDATLQEYRLYGKKLEDPDTSYAVLATFTPADTLQYVHKNLAVGQKYAYLVGVVNKAGLELRSGPTVSN
jgi:hypothetical protein